MRPPTPVGRRDSPRGMAVDRRPAGELGRDRSKIRHPRDRARPEPGRGPRVAGAGDVGRPAGTLAAEEEFQLALSLNPSYSLAHFWYAALLEEEARAEDALREFLLAEGADPFGPGALLHLALLLTWSGRYDEALAKIRKLGELEPAGIAVHQALANYYLARSELEQCLKEVDLVAGLEPDPGLQPLHRAYRYALSGQGEKATNLLRQKDALPEFGQIAPSVARVYAELGDLDACFAWLEKARQSGSLPLQPWRLDPRLGHVRNDPRFPVLLKKMNLA